MGSGYPGWRGRTSETRLARGMPNEKNNPLHRAGTCFAVLTRLCLRARTSGEVGGKQ